MLKFLLYLNIVLKNSLANGPKLKTAKENVIPSYCTSHKRTDFCAYYFLKIDF